MDIPPVSGIFPSWIFRVVGVSMKEALIANGLNAITKNTVSSDTTITTLKF